MSALKDLMNRYTEGDALTNIETLIVIVRDEKAAAELAALRERVERAEAERDKLKELIKQAQGQLRSTQINWQEEFLFNCDDILTNAIQGDA